MKFQTDLSGHDTFTHQIIIVGRDSFMSGWGEAKGGSSWAGWACKQEHADKVEKWVRKRGDIKRVARKDHSYRPTGRGHYHIYIVNEGHPALNQ